MTRQLTASPGDKSMLRGIIAVLMLAAALAVSAVAPAAAQPAPLCTRFEAGQGGQDHWGPCPAAPNIVVTTSNVGSIGGASDYYLHLRDTSGASAACSTDEKYLGDWIKKLGNCGQFCFDFKVFQSGFPPGPITPSFTLWGPAGLRATFVANFTVTANDPWRQNICAPINLIQNGQNLPSGPSGQWRIAPTGNAYSADWNTIIQGVTMVQFPIDFTSQPSEEAGYDNLCMNPQDCKEPPKPPKVTGCLEDSKVEVKCNGDGTYTLTLNSGAFTGDQITLTSQTPGVTVTPPQQVWSASTSWTIVGATSGQTVTLTANSTKVGGGSEKGTDLCCSGEIVIVMPDCPKPPPLTVVKKVVNETDADLTGWQYPVTVVCDPSPSTGFNLADGQSGTVSVPLGVNCKVGEDVSNVSLPPSEKACPEGQVPQWSVTISPAGYAHAGDTVTVENRLQCVKPETGTITVEKKVENRTRADLSGWTFPVTVTCDPAPNASFPLADGGTGSVNNVPFGVDCKVGEDLSQVVLPTKGCPQGTVPQWSMTTSPTGYVHAGDTVTIVNILECVKSHVVTPPPACDPATTRLSEDTCVCRYRQMNRTSPTSCECREGTHLVAGKGCVEDLTCRRPLIPNSAGTACVCGAGLVKRGNRCVAPLECHRPLVPNSAGTACVCGAGLLKRGNRCVEPIECRPPLVLNSAGTDCVCPEHTTRRGRRCVRTERPVPDLPDLRDLPRLPSFNSDDQPREEPGK